VSNSLPLSLLLRSNSSYFSCFVLISTHTVKQLGNFGNNCCCYFSAMSFILMNNLLFLIKPSPKSLTQPYFV